MAQYFYSTNQKNFICININRDEFVRHRGQAGLKYYPVLMFFLRHVQNMGELNFSLDELAEESGYASKPVSPKIYDGLRMIIKSEIIDRGFAVSSCDIMSCAPSQRILLQLSFNNNIFKAGTPYTSFSLGEFEKIKKGVLKQREGRPRISNTVGTYIGVKLCIDHALNVAYDGVKLILAFPTQQQMVELTGLSLSTIKKNINILCGVGVLQKFDDLYVRCEDRKSYFTPARTVYCFNSFKVPDDVVTSVASDFYGRDVFTRRDVPGKIVFYDKNGVILKNPNSKERIIH